MLKNKTVGCIGVGNMGSAIISGLSVNLNKNNIFAYDTDKLRLEYIKTTYCIETTNNAAELAEKSDFIIIAVKPDIVLSVIDDIKNNVSYKIISSIAAGVTLKSIENNLSNTQKIIRVMPNTPALIGMGMTVLSPNKHVDEESLNLASE